MQSAFKYIGWIILAFIIIFSLKSTFTGNTENYEDSDQFHDAIMDSTEYQDLYDELETTKTTLEESNECIETLKTQLDDVNSKAMYAQDEDSETMNEALYDINSGSNPECDTP
jgi:hypothetical protein